MWCHRGPSVALSACLTWMGCQQAQQKALLQGSQTSCVAAQGQEQEMEVPGWEGLGSAQYHIHPTLVVKVVPRPAWVQGGTKTNVIEGQGLCGHLQWPCESLQAGLSTVCWGQQRPTQIHPETHRCQHAP